MRSIPIRLLTVAAMMAATAPAQDANEKAVEAWKAAQAAQAKYDKVLQEARSILKEAPRGDAEAMKKFRALTTEPRLAKSEADEAFATTFAKTDPRSWDLASHRKLVETGLRAAMRELIESDPTKAVEFGHTFLELLPSSQQAKQVKTYDLPRAYIAAGELQQGIAFVEQTLKDLEPADAANLRITLGDMLTACGDLNAARDAYTKSADQAGELDERLANRIRGYTDLRLTLVGKPAPEIDSAHWIGDEAAPLSKLRGKVIVVDFWATWCGPCRHVMPALNALYEEKKAEGLVTLGVTRFYDRGYLPADASQMTSGGESVRDMDEAAFDEHLKAFKQNTGISYPFVVGEKQDFGNYKVTGIPTVAVIDQDGNVALVAVGGGSEPLVRAVVERLLD